MMDVIALALNRPPTFTLERTRPPSFALGSFASLLLAQNPGLWFSILLTMLIPARLFAAEKDILSKFSIVEQPWQQKNRCGPNCLILFLQSHGQKIAPLEILTDVALTDRGASLQGLKEQSALFGVSTEVVRARRDALDTIPLPAIAHHGQGLNEHYVLLCEVGREHVVVVDGSTLSVKREERSEFEKEWSGYLLVRAEDSEVVLKAGILALSILCVVTAFLCCCGTIFSRQEVRSRQPVSESAKVSLPS